MQEIEKTVENKRLAGKEKNLMEEILHLNEPLTEMLIKIDEALALFEENSPIKSHETFGAYQSKIKKLSQASAIIRRHLINILVEDKLYSQIKGCVDKMDRDLKKRRK